MMHYLYYEYDIKYFGVITRVFVIPSSQNRLKIFGRL